MIWILKTRKLRMIIIVDMSIRDILLILVLILSISLLNFSDFLWISPYQIFMDLIRNNYISILNIAVDKLASIAKIPRVCSQQSPKIRGKLPNLTFLFYNINNIFNHFLFITELWGNQIVLFI